MMADARIQALLAAAGLAAVMFVPALLYIRAVNDLHKSNVPPHSHIAPLWRQISFAIRGLWILAPNDPRQQAALRRVRWAAAICLLVFTAGLIVIAWYFYRR